MGLVMAWMGLSGLKYASQSSRVARLVDASFWPVYAFLDDIQLNNA